MRIVTTTKGNYLRHWFRLYWIDGPLASNVVIKRKKRRQTVKGDVTLVNDVPRGKRVGGMNGTYVHGILLNSDGTIRPLPFRTKKDGMWYFDGQFYFQRGVGCGN